MTSQPEGEDFPEEPQVEDNVENKEEIPEETSPHEVPVPEWMSDDDDDDDDDDVNFGDDVSSIFLEFWKFS